MILGIDTSCYTTSVAAVGLDAPECVSIRKMLEVPQGSLGLRQSDAFFIHIRQLPVLLQDLYKKIEPKQLLGISVSTRPRNLSESYMPVFYAGEAMAKVIADTLSLSLFLVSHQEGHIAAAIKDHTDDLKEEFLAVHLSGGTTEVLKVKKLSGGFEVKILGGCDLSAGKFIDMIGVSLGLPFPSGPAMEKLAADNKAGYELPISVKGCEISFSGPETAAARLIDKGAAPEEIAAAVLDQIAQSLIKALAFAAEQTGLKQIVLAGGVICNRRIRQQLEQNLKDSMQLFFADREYAGDNAVGVALLGKELYKATTP